MKDKLLTYAVVASIAVHVVLLVMVGKTSAAKPIAVDRLKIVQVDLMKTPDEVAVSENKPDAPKPKVEQPSQPAKIDVPYVPPINKMVENKHPPKPVSVRPTQHPVPYVAARDPGTQRRVPANTVPGNPGGEVKMGTTNRGQDMGYVPRGGTPSGWVPSTNGGSGRGSGTGLGVGTPEPDPNASDGPGTRPAPAIITPPPPRMIDVTVCAISGSIPGRYCERKETRAYRDGSEPGSACDRCKAPEPKHINRLADRSEPELIKDVQPNLPELDESGDYIVWVHYTVDTDGGVSNIDITDSSGLKAIDRAVQNAVSRLKYKPAVQNGEPRSVRIKRKYKISF